MNKEFKYGDEVIGVSTGEGYVYLSPHPTKGGCHFLYTIDMGRPVSLHTTNFKLKPKTHIVNGVECPAPISTYTEDLERAYVISVFTSSRSMITSRRSAIEAGIKLGLAFYTKEDAIANIKAMEKRGVQL